jgi:hypothetical protein
LIWCVSETALKKKTVFGQWQLVFQTNSIVRFILVVFWLVVLVGLGFGSAVLNLSPAQSVYFTVSALTGVGALSMDPFMYPYWVLNCASVYSVVAVIVGNVLISLLVRRFRISGTCRITTLKLWEMAPNGRIDMGMVFPQRESKNAAESHAVSRLASPRPVASESGDAEMAGGNVNAMGRLGTVSEDELQLLLHLGIRRPNDYDKPTVASPGSGGSSGYISRQEFLVLTALRLGILSYSDTLRILETYDKLECADVSGKASVKFLYGEGKLGSVRTV